MSGDDTERETVRKGQRLKVTKAIGHKIGNKTEHKTESKTGADIPKTEPEPEKKAEKDMPKPVQGETDGIKIQKPEESRTVGETDGIKIQKPEKSRTVGETGRRVQKLKKKRKRRHILLGSSMAAALLLLLAVFFVLARKLNIEIPGISAARPKERPEAVLEQYYLHAAKGEYDRMYRMLDAESQTTISRKDFVKRHENIYQGIEADQFAVKIKDVDMIKNGSFSAAVTYYVTMDTAAGEITFQNRTFFAEAGEEGDAPYSYTISWDDSMIFPELTAKDRVSISKKSARRGNIYDRNGKLLAGEGTASMVGLVPKKMDPDSSGQDIKKLAEILGISVKSIQNKLKAEWVQEDFFVPIKTIEKLTDLEQMTDIPGEHVKKKMERNAALLAIAGVKITDTQVRQYPLGKAASHLVGYVQNATAEDLEAHAGEGYTENSLIGKSGIESLYEKELKGTDGCEILLVDADGETKTRLAYIDPQDGADIYLTIDAGLQETIYHAFAQDKGCSTAMDPYTGEILALVSTPSFDANDFVLGMSDTLWENLNQDENKPLYNRFRQKLCPGSSFKPVIAAIGIQTGAIDPQRDYGSVGLKWQKDGGWGGYYVTTLHEYEPVTLENAMIYSDNIYFARAALRIGKKKLQKSLQQLGFHETLPFELSLAQSQYSNSDHIESEIQLADSGYGQGQVLVNPVHLAALYTGFLNNGDVIKPYLRCYKETKQADKTAAGEKDTVCMDETAADRADTSTDETAAGGADTGMDKTAAGGEIWLKSAYTPQAAKLVKNAMIQVVESEDGTGHRAYRKGTTLAAKTGTAEIKQSKEDKNGTELGWFAVFTADGQQERPLLLLSMAEDVRSRGGSGYVVEKDRKILDYWLRRK